MDLNEITHFLKRAVSFKMRDAGTVTWASERPAPRAPRRAPGIDRLRLFRGPRELWGARARRTGKPRRSCGPFFPLLSGRFPFLSPSRLRCYRGRRLACLAAALLAVPPPGPLNPGPRHPAAEPRAAPAHVTGSLTA